MKILLSLISLLLFIGCDPMTMGVFVATINSEPEEEWCFDPYAINCSGWTCDNLDVYQDPIQQGKNLFLENCEYCVDVYSTEECCGVEEALNYNPEASIWDTSYCIFE